MDACHPSAGLGQRHCLAVMGKGDVVALVIRVLHGDQKLPDGRCVGGEVLAQVTQPPRWFCARVNAALDVSTAAHLVDFPHWIAPM